MTLRSSQGNVIEKQIQTDGRHQILRKQTEAHGDTIRHHQTPLIRQQSPEIQPWRFDV